MPSPAKSRPTNDEKREELRDKIEAAEARQAERSLADQAREARDNAVGFVREHPLGTVSAALAFGILVAAIVPGPGRRLRKRVGTKVSNRAAPLAAMVAEMGLAYASSVGDFAANAVRTGQNALEDVGDSIGQTTRNVGRGLSHHADRVTDNATSVGRKVQAATERAARKARIKDS